jgi:hypothetical protein
VRKPACRGHVGMRRPWPAGAGLRANIGVGPYECPHCGARYSAQIIDVRQVGRREVPIVLTKRWTETRRLRAVAQSSGRF